MRFSIAILLIFICRSYSYASFPIIQKNIELHSIRLINDSNFNNDSFNHQRFRLRNFTHLEKLLCILLLSPILFPVGLVWYFVKSSQDGRWGRIWVALIFWSITVLILVSSMGPVGLYV